MESKTVGAESHIGLKILYDNNDLGSGLASDWGFSCLICVAEKNILFDTGHNGDMLLYNMKKTSIDPEQIDYIFLSHAHYDHFGGIEKVLEQNQKAQIFIHDGFSSESKSFLAGLSSNVTVIDKGQKLFGSVYSTGVMGEEIKEQSLYIEGANEVFLITGCAHPGVANIAKKVRSKIPSKPLNVLGGFHMLYMNRAEISDTICQLDDLGLKCACPTHCSGDKTREMMKDAYGDSCKLIGVGSELKLDI